MGVVIRRTSGRNAGPDVKREDGRNGQDVKLTRRKKKLSGSKYGETINPEGECRYQTRRQISRQVGDGIHRGLERPVDPQHLRPDEGLDFER